MKLAVLAALSLLAACKDKPREPAATPPPAPGSAAPAADAAIAAVAAAPPDGAEAGVPVVDACGISSAALATAACPSADAAKGLARAKDSIDQIVQTVGTIGSADTRQMQVMCAQLLSAIERDAKKLGCTLTIPPAQRTEIAALLDAWFGQRTQVEPTGDAAVDAVIARMVAVREAACACRDAACLDALDKELVKVPPFPAKAPDGARELGVKVLEDAARCAQRVRLLGGAAAGSGSGAAR